MTATAAAGPGAHPRSGGWPFLEALSGRRTYLVALIGAAYVFGSSVGWWPCDERVLALLGFGGIAALRRAVPAKP